MCGTPGSNLATTIMNNSKMKEEKKEYARTVEKKKEEARKAKEYREEQSKLYKGTMRAKTAGNGIDITKGTPRVLEHKEEIEKRDDIEEIDTLLKESIYKDTKALGKKETALLESNMRTGMNSVMNFGKQIGKAMTRTRSKKR